MKIKMLYRYDLLNRLTNPVWSMLLITLALFAVPEVSSARYLNVDTGRFMTMDAFEGDQEDPLSLHKYVYVEDNPVNMIDPSGNDFEDLQINYNLIYNLLAEIGAPVAQNIAGPASVDVHFDYINQAFKRKYYHAYILLHGPGGLTYGFRGGPSVKYPQPSYSAVIRDYSFIEPHGANMNSGYLTDAGSGGLYVYTWVDYPHKSTDNVAQFSVAVGSQSFSQLYVGLMLAANHIESLHLPYHPVRQNSNSFAKTLLVKNGLPAPRQTPVWAPGWNHILY